MKPILNMLIGILLAGSLSLQANVISDFSSGDDGWRSVTLGFPNPGAPPIILGTSVPTFLASGGDPGSYIFNGDPDPNVQYWLAPAKYLGNQSSAYLSSLLFSLADSPIGTEFTQADLILTGAGLTLTRQLPSTPNGTWTAYSIPFTVGAWTLDSPAGATASAAQLQSVLGSLDGLYIRGEYYLSNDQQSIDSVTLQQNAPEPATGAGMLCAVAALWAARRRN
jgi:hypothetical protein